MRKVIFITIFLICSQLGKAQQVFSIFGGSYQSESISISYAAGEVISGTQNAEEVSFLQGVIQPLVAAGTGTKAKEVLDLNLRVFPIPSTGLININGKELEGATIFVYDLHGNVVKQMKDNQIDRVKLDLENQAKGVYLIRVLNNGKQLNRKIILQ